MKIEIATAKYIDQISLLYEEFFRYNENLQPEFYNSAKECGQYPKYIINNDNDDLIIAVDDNIVLGLIHVMEDKTEPYNCIAQYKLGVIVDFIVTEKFRGQGIGTALMNAAKHWCCQRDVDYMELKVIADNVDVYKFYHHQGFNTTMNIMRYKIKSVE